MNLSYVFKFNDLRYDVSLLIDVISSIYRVCESLCTLEKSMQNYTAMCYNNFYHKQIFVNKKQALVFCLVKKKLSFKIKILVFLLINNYKVLFKTFLMCDTTDFTDISLKCYLI